jgi:hypothetical protein
MRCSRWFNCADESCKDLSIAIDRVLSQRIEPLFPANALDQEERNTAAGYEAAADSFSLD